MVSASTGGGTLVVSPSTVDFGTVQVGQSATSKVSFSNESADTVEVAQLSVAGTTFSVADQGSLPARIAPGETYNFVVGFKPTGEGTYSGKFTAMNSSGAALAQGSISGSGVTTNASSTRTLSVSSTTLSFGNVAVGSSATLPVTLTSTGSAAVTINSASVSGAGFTVSGATFPLTLNPQQSATLQVQAAPSATGADTGALTISSNASTNATTVVNLTSTGTNTGATAPQPQLTISPTYLSFGNVTTGSSATLPVTLTSTGTAAVTISSASISGTGFTVSGAAFPMTLSPKQTATLNVKFAPATTGTDRGTLAIRSNASANPNIYLNMTGSGVNATTPNWTMSTTSLNFGNVAVNSSATLPVTITSSGTASLTINSDAISGTGFTVSGATLPMTLSPKQTVTLNVKFAPTTSGSATGTLTVKSNASTNPTVAVSLTGTGTTTSQLTVSPTSLSFGDVTVGLSATLPVKLTSSGTGSVTINSATISGKGFTMSGATFPVTLAAKQAVTLQVNYAPTTTTASTGTITISSNSSTNPTVTVNLSGTGVTHEVDLSWSAPSSSIIPIAGYHIYRATGTSTSYQLLNSSVDTQTSYADKSVASGTSYSYYVKSVDALGLESSPSNQITVTVP